MTNTRIPQNCDVVFVADLFVDDYVGGAELTSEALISSSPLRVHKVRSSQVSVETLESGHDKFWIFGNFSQLDINLIPTIIANMRYAVLEYDYKFCRYRSPELHRSQTGLECDCDNQVHGKLVSSFYYGAKSVWWMSEGQQRIYHTRFPFLNKVSNVVLSSVFDERFFVRIKQLNAESSERKGWIVLGSNSWVKGYENAVEWCKREGKEYEVVWNVPYDELLRKLSCAEGFVYLPQGYDTCPRMVIEAKLLGCKLHLNDYVQHKDEEWFASSDPLDTESYLYAARERFWNAIKHDMNYVPRISGYTTTHNCATRGYPFEESIRSLAGFCDEIVVVDAGSDDGTLENLGKLSDELKCLKVVVHTVDWSSKGFAYESDGKLKALARSLCTGDICWQQDVDEVVHEDDYAKIKNLASRFPNGVDLIGLPVIEYWGSAGKVRIDVNAWKWRMSRNLPHITHGIPGTLRRYDDEGDLYAAEGTDGCDYINSGTLESIPFVTFVTVESEQARLFVLQNPDHPVLKQYELWFNNQVGAIPGVHHYSWFNIKRKILNYKDHWAKFWSSLYDKTYDDTPENNVFMNKRWVDVTDEDAGTVGGMIEDSTGGWIFHRRIDFSRKTPSISVNRSHPSVMSSWIEKFRR